jgi:hypothetical protein
MSVKIQAFDNENEEFAHVSNYILNLIKKGVNPNEIAVLAKNHSTLQDISSVLNDLEIKINYERKENILENSHIRWIISYLKLILNLSKGLHDEVDYLIPEIISHEFWQLHPFIVYDISLRAYRNKLNWLEIMKDYECTVFEDNQVNFDVSKKIREISFLFIKLTELSLTEPVEVILDYILGNKEIDFTNSKTSKNKEYIEKEEIASYEEEGYETLYQLA